MARSGAGRRRWRPLPDHVVRGALAPGEPVLNDEHDDFRWLTPEAIDGLLGDLKVTDGLAEVIEAARRLLQV